MIRFPFILRGGARLTRVPAESIARADGTIPPGTERSAPEYHRDWMDRGPMIRCCSAGYTVLRGIAKDWRLDGGLCGIRKLPEDVATEAEAYDARIAEAQRAVWALVHERDDMLDAAWPRCEKVRVGDVQTVEQRIAKNKALAAGDVS